MHILFFMLNLLIYMRNIFIFFCGVSIMKYESILYTHTLLTNDKEKKIRGEKFEWNNQRISNQNTQKLLTKYKKKNGWKKRAKFIYLWTICAAKKQYQHCFLMATKCLTHTRNQRINCNLFLRMHSHLKFEKISHIHEIF